MKLKGDNIIIQSFSVKSLRLIKKMIPNLPTCLLVSGFEFDELSRAKLKQLALFADYISLPELLITSEFVSVAEQFGLKIIAWNVNSWDEYMRLKQMGVNGIVTNSPNIHKLAFLRNNNITSYSNLETEKSRINYTDLLTLFHRVANELLNFFNSLK
jgi:hypothetical protein